MGLGMDGPSVQVFFFTRGQEVSGQAQLFVVGPKG